jgi:hypothetical protein
MYVKMAKPIRATPKLTVVETNFFLKSMTKNDKAKITASDKEIAKNIINCFC